MLSKKMLAINFFIGVVAFVGCANVFSSDKVLASHFLSESVRTRDELLLKQLKEDLKEKSLQEKGSIHKFLEQDLVDVKSLNIKARPINSQLAIEISSARYQRTGEVEALITGNDLILFPYGLVTPQMKCAILNPCSIELEAQEEIIDTLAGDTQRWWIGYSFSGSGVDVKPHVIVKPLVDAELRTSLLITTNKRVYYITLLSVQEGEYTPRIGFFYPTKPVRRTPPKMISPQVEKVKEKSASLAFLDVVDKYNLNYKIKGNKRKVWFPKRVFDDGHQTFIQMQDSIISSEAPVFVVIGRNGVYENVNYRFKNSVYIIDRLFDKGALVFNTNGKEEKIRIFRK